MVPRAALNWCGKSRPKLGFDIQTAQLLASHSTDYAILPHQLCVCVCVCVRVRVYTGVLGGMCPTSGECSLC